MPIPLALGVASVGASLLGTGINAWMTYRGAEKAEKAHAASTKKQERVFERQFAEERRSSRVAEGLQRKSLEETKKQNAFNRQQSFVNNFLSTLNTNPATRAQYISIARGRR